MGDTERRQRVEHRVGDRRRRADGAGLADALDPERVHRRRRHGVAEDVVGDVVRARQRVVHEFTGQELAAVVVDGLLEQHLADRVGDAALHLALDDQRVDQRAAVVDRGVLGDLHLAGVAVHVDGDDVRAEGEGEVLRLEEARRFEPRLEAGRQVLRDVGRAGQFRPGDLAVGHARRAEQTALEGHVIAGGLEEVCRQRLRLGDDLVDAHDDRRSADRRAAAAVSVAAIVGDVGVAVQDDDVLDRHAEAVADELRERRLLPLAVRRHAGDHGDLRRDLHAHAAPFPAAGRHRRRRPHRADLDVGRDADARQLARGPRRRAIRDQLIPVHQLFRLGERALVVAAVVGQAARRGERELRRLRKVLEPQLDAIDAELGGDHVHQPLDQVGCFRAPGAAVGVGRHLVGVDADDLHLDRGDLVAAGEHQAGERRHRRRQQLQVRPEIGDRPRPHPENRAVVLDRDFVFADLVAAVNRRGGVLAARLDPFDRRAEAHGEVPDQRLLGVDVQLGAEAAADLRRDDPQLVLRHREHPGQQRPDQVRNLGRGPQRQRLFAGVIRRDHAARLDRHRRQPLVVEAVGNDPVGVLERGVDVAAAGDGVGVGDVRIERTGVGQRRAGFHRLFGVGHGGQRIVVDVDRVDRIARDVRIGRDHDRHGVADEVDAVARQDGVLGRLEIGNRGGARHQAARSVDVGAGQDGDDARDRARGGDVDASDARVRVRAAQDGRMEHPGQAQVVDVGRQPLDQARILDPLHRPADVRCQCFSHATPP